MPKKKGLGKGLEALFADNTTEDGAVATLRITDVEPNRAQPRRAFEEDALRELADSIREYGVIQPLVVRPLEAGGYQIVAGERRWRAARMAGVSEVPAVIRELSDAQTLEIAIIENLQREDLNPIELAQGYKTLIDQYGMTQEQVGQRMGKSRPVIANTLRLLTLPERVRDSVARGEVSLGHAKALLALEEETLIQEVAGRIIREGLLVRDVEKLAQKRKKLQGEPKQGGAQPAPKQEHVWGESYHREMELALGSELGRKVHISRQGKKCVLELEFYSDEELADLAARLTRS